MRIGAVDTAERTAIVAEIGNNHEGDVAVARELVHAAADAGAHAVKFQAIVPEQLVRPTETARIEQLRGYQLTPDDFAGLQELARSLGLGFSCTPFALAAVTWLTPLVDVFKIASGDNDVLPLLRAVGAAGKPVLFSTGMSDLARAAWTRDRLLEAGAPEVAALHCVSAYPTAPAEARLGTIPALAAGLGIAVGYSDHTLGIEACVAAVALGARVLEKHLTLRHDFSDFRDHQLSAEPDELRALAERVAEVETLVSGGVKDGVLPVEVPVAAAARRALVATVDLPEGHVLGEDDLAWLRPGDGLSPSAIDDVVGRPLARAVPAGRALAPEDLGEPRDGGV